MKYRILTSLSLVLLLSLALMLTLVSCGGEPNASAFPASSPQPSADNEALQPPSDTVTANPPGLGAQESDPPPEAPTSAPVVQTPAQADPTPAADPVPSAPDEPMTMERAYQAALEGIYWEHRYPNGDDVGLIDFDPAVAEPSEMEKNDFAIFDVDGDGKDELVYQNDNSYIAGMVTTIFGFDPDTGKLYQELSGFCGMTFYDNGIVTVMASHNQGLAGTIEDFWPYTLYQYDPGSDGYLMAGSIDAWDGTTFPQDYSGSPFPGDVDADGDRVVYTITSAGQEVVSTTVDGPEYQQWLDSYLAGASKVDLPWQAMTEGNIRAVAP